MIILVAACNQQGIKNKDVINLNVDEADIDIKTPYSDIFESFDIVQLKQSKSNIIGRIHDLRLIGDTFFIFDMQFAKCLFLYNINGEFITKVGTIGKGPGEYISPSSFFVDHPNQVIYISDRQLQKIFKYSYDGTFIKEIKMGCRGQSIFVCPNKDIFIDVAIRNDEKYLFKSINEETLKEDHYLKFPDHNKGWDINAIFNKNKFFPLGDRVLYYNYSSDIIYQIYKKSISPFIAINSKNPLTKKEISKISKDVSILDESLYKLNSEGKYFGIYDFLMTDRLAFIKINYQFWPIDFIYSFKQNKIIGQNLIDDLTHIPARSFLGTYENKMIRVLPLNSYDFEDYKVNLKLGKISLPTKNMEKILNIVDIDNNPVILLYKIKDNI